MYDNQPLNVFYTLWWHIEKKDNKLWHCLDTFWPNCICRTVFRSMPLTMPFEWCGHMHAFIHSYFVNNHLLLFNVKGVLEPIPAVTSKEAEIYPGQIKSPSESCMYVHIYIKESFGICHSRLFNVHIFILNPIHCFINTTLAHCNWKIFIFYNQNFSTYYFLNFCWINRCSGHRCPLPDRVVIERDSQWFETAQQLCVSVVWL